MATTTQSLFISILSATVYCNLEIFLECFAKWTWIFSTFVLILSLDYEECVFLTFRRWIEPRFPKKAELSKYHNIGRISACSNVNMIPQRFHAENCTIEWNSFWNIPALNKRSKFSKNIFLSSLVKALLRLHGSLTTRFSK